MLVPAPLLFLLFMGLQDRFFARWLLPVYPLLCLLAAWAAVELAGRSRWRLAPSPARCCARRGSSSPCTTTGCSRAPTRGRWPASGWSRNIPEGTRVVIEPIAPDQWATDVGRPSRLTDNGAPLGQVADLELPRRSGSSSRTTSARSARRCCGATSAAATASWSTGSTQKGRALREPADVPGAIAYYRALDRRSDVLYRVSPHGDGAPIDQFSFDFSFNGYPLAYDRLGPEIVIRRLRSGGLLTRESIFSWGKP